MKYIFSMKIFKYTFSFDFLYYVDKNHIHPPKKELITLFLNTVRDR